MAHFAEIDREGVVLRVVVIDNGEILDPEGKESEDLGTARCRELFGGDLRWLQTSYNGTIRKNYAGIGYVYDSGRDAFVPPKPYQSWILNPETCKWEPPVPAPQPAFGWVWNEEQQEWVEVA